MAVNLAGEAASSSRRIAQGAAALLAASILVLALRSVPAEAFGPDVSTFTLANGMEVVVIPDHRAPVATHMVWYRVGAADEGPGKSGIAHFLEHLMFKGTHKIAPGEFSKIVARHGGQDNAFTSLDYTGYFQKVAKDRLALVMELEADRMTNLVLTDELVLPERDVVLEERRSRTENNPQARLGEQMNAAFYYVHPYGKPVIGWPNEINALNRRDAIEFYDRFYSPNNAILIIAGDVTAEEVRPLAEKFYGVIPIRAEIGPRLRPEEPEHEAAIRVILKDPRATAPVLQRSYLSPSYATADPGEAEALDVLAEILGGGTTSRLYEQLVVDRKVATSAGAYYSGDSLDNGRLGLYGLAADGTSMEDLEKAIDAVVAEIADKGVTAEEVARASSSLIAQAIYALDSQGHMARIYGASLTTGMTVEDVKDWPNRVAKVSAEHVRDAARAHLRLEKSVTGILLKDDGPPGDRATNAPAGAADKS
jgi:zinc protease